MATCANSTTAPARPLLPLVALTFRPTPPIDDPRTAVEILDEIRRIIEEQVDAEPRPELPPEPLLPAADRARAIHLRRRLETAAEHGIAMLAALGLPRLVEPDFVQVDPVAAGDAVEAAIAALDAFDADPDLEDGADDEASLGWERPGSQFLLTGGGAFGDDRELDTADDEPSLASPERHPRIPTVTWGRVYTARGGDEGQLRWAEGAQHDGEAVNEDGDDLDRGEHDTANHESYLGWPEDVGAVMRTETCFLTADPDAEHDDVDLEDGDDDDDRAVPWWDPRVFRLPDGSLPDGSHV